MSDQPMIVRARTPKHRTKTQARTMPPVAAVVTAGRPGLRHRGPETFDPEAEAAVKAWFAINIRPPG